MNDTNKTLSYYMTLHYTIQLEGSPRFGWFAKIKELQGCMSQGDTYEETMANLREAMVLWIETSLEDGDPIPEPPTIKD